MKIVLSITIYKIVNNLLFFNEGIFELDRVFSEIASNIVEIGKGNEVISKGFSMPERKRENDIDYLELYGFETATYGTYNETLLINNQLHVKKSSFDFFTSCRILVLETQHLVLISSNTVEEKTKVRIRRLVESLGIEMNIQKITPEFLKSVSEDRAITVVSCKKDDIDSPEDSTKKISYEIDPSDSRNSSKANDLYKNIGNFTTLELYYPYRHNRGNDSMNLNIPLTLYNNGNRIAFNPLILNGGSEQLFIIKIIDYFSSFWSHEV